MESDSTQSLQVCCLFAKVSVLLNIAAVHMEQGEYAAACSSCTAALVLDPENVKGLVRRAQCYIAKHEHKVSSPRFSNTNPCFWLQLLSPRDLAVSAQLLAIA